MEKALEVVRTPDPDPFADIGHLAIGQLHKDDKHKVECEVCHRHLKSFDLMVEHVKNFHPTVFYDCVFCPGAVFYTIRIYFHIARKTTLYVINVTVRTMTRTHSRSTWSPNIQLQYKPQIQARDQVLYVVNVTCTVIQRLVLRLHLVTHKKTPCPYCPQKFYDAASRNKHVDLKHSDRCNRRLNCRIAPACKETFNNIRGLGIHSRQVHWAA